MKKETLGDLIDRHATLFDYTKDSFEKLLVEHIGKAYDDDFKMLEKSHYNGGVTKNYFGKPFTYGLKEVITKITREHLIKINNMNRKARKEAKIWANRKLYTLDDVILYHDDIFFLKDLLKQMKLSYHILRSIHNCSDKIKPHVWQNEVEQRILMLILKMKQNEKTYNI